MTAKQMLPVPESYYYGVGKAKSHIGLFRRVHLYLKGVIVIKLKLSDMDPQDFMGHATIIKKKPE